MKALVILAALAAVASAVLRPVNLSTAGPLTTTQPWINTYPVPDWPIIDPLYRYYMNPLVPIYPYGMIYPNRNTMMPLIFMMPMMPIKPMKPPITQDVINSIIHGKPTV